MSVDGMKELDRKLAAMSEMDLKEEISRAIDYVQQCAVGNVSSHTNMGELKQSIYKDVYESGDSVIGECFTNKEYSIYVELGTGPRGQENHAGISPDANPVYTQSPWWIHESQIDRSLAEKYHWFYIDTPQGRFYQCNGQPAHPFMYPALKDNRDTILKDFKTDFVVNLKGIIK